MHSSRSDREAFWRDTLANWKRSGLSISAFCRQHALNLSSFHHWKNRLANTTPDTATFVPIAIVAETLVEIVMPSGIVLKLPLDCDATHLVALLKAVKSC